MITEDYVSFEVAKLLKEKGFNEITEDFYDSSGKSDDEQALYGGSLKFGRNFWNNDPFIKSGYPEFVTFARPTQSIVLKWLREVHNIFIAMNVSWAEGDMRNPISWMCEVIDMNTTKRDYSNFIHRPTYEEAVEAALKYTLENLI